MGWPNEYNIIQHRGKQKKCCIIQHLFGEKFDRDQTSYKIQHDKTRYNKVAKRVQHFIKHQSCMMLYEMMYSFGWGFKNFYIVTSFADCLWTFSTHKASKEKAYVRAQMFLNMNCIDGGNLVEPIHIEH